MVPELLQACAKRDGLAHVVAEPTACACIASTVGGTWQRARSYAAASAEGGVGNGWRAISQQRGVGYRG